MALKERKLGVAITGKERRFIWEIAGPNLTLVNFSLVGEVQWVPALILILYHFEYLDIGLLNTSKSLK